jgi:cyclopropane-fatty-acyl-phospholipid synthase
MAGHTTLRPAGLRAGAAAALLRRAAVRLGDIAEAGGVPFAIRLPAQAAAAAGDGTGEVIRFGRGEPGFVLVARGPAGVAALASLERTRLAEAFIAGELDLEGETTHVLALRELFPQRALTARLWRFVQPLLFGQVRADEEWIPQHYDEDPDFYQLFLDRRHRCYSQGLFTHPQEPLEDAVTRKLEYALAATRLEPGQTVLDVGGGWGAFTEFAGRRGIHVTSLTISPASERYIQELILRAGLPCRVVRQHLMDHHGGPYDAIVNLGVTEHLPDYRASLEKYRSLLRPGGRVCLDASAAREKHDLSEFFLRHIFPGNGSPLCLHEYLAHVAASPFEVLEVQNDRENYALTARRWAENLDRHRAEIELRWGRPLHRRFHLYLWGCVDGFARDVIQAYRWVLALR